LSLEGGAPGSTGEHEQDRGSPSRDPRVAAACQAGVGGDAG